MKEATLKKELIRRVEHLPDDRLQEVLEYVEYLLYKDEQQAATSARIQEPSQDPLLKLIGTVDVAPFAHTVDDEIYGA